MNKQNSSYTIAMQSQHRIVYNQLTRWQWILLIVYGLIFYTIVQGSIFIGLAYLQAATGSLILSFTSGMVAVFGNVWLAERPTINTVHLATLETPANKKCWRSPALFHFFIASLKHRIYSDASREPAPKA